MTTTADPTYYKRWRIERSRGLKRTTSSAKAQDHIRELTAAGLTIRSIADAAGVDGAVISALNRGHKKSLKVVTEKKLLAVSAQQVYSRPMERGFVPRIGATRRVQALMVMGYRYQDLTKMLGFNVGVTICQPGEFMSRKKHEAIAELYNKIWNIPGPATATSRVRIAKAGYAPPLAWDEETIDDPAAQPNLGQKLKRCETIADDVEFLAKTGADRDEIGQRLGRPWETIERQLHRIKRSDIIAMVKTGQAA